MLEAGVVGDIAGQSERTAPQGLHRGSSGAHQFHATAGGDHVRSRLGESRGESQPDAAGSADYDRGLVLEFEKRMTHEEVRCAFSATPPSLILGISIGIAGLQVLDS